MTIARITRPHGVRGEVVALSLTDFPERFARLETVRVATEAQVSWEILEGYRFHKNRILLKFAGLSRPNEVEHLIGGEVQVPEADRVKPPPDTYFHSDLIGCEVFNRERPLGAVQRVLETGAAALLVIEAVEGEILIPMAKQFLRKVDPEMLRIDVDLPGELIVLNQISASSRRRKKEREDRRAQGSKPG